MLSDYILTTALKPSML